MTLNQNQFSQSVQKGQLDLKYAGAVYSCIVASGTLVPGQRVKLIDTANKSILVGPITADTDEVFGVVAYDLKKTSFGALEAVEIASHASVIYCEASAAIARGAEVMPVVTGAKIATATDGKSVFGITLDKASADGDLVRVLILKSNAKGYTLLQQSAIADLNQTISGAYDQAEVQAISDKVDAILASLRLAGVIASA